LDSKDKVKKMAVSREEGLINRKDPLPFLIKEDTDGKGFLTEDRITKIIIYLISG
jgi:hypothetical protein